MRTRRWLVRENAYRDVWLLIITVLVIGIAIKALDTATTEAHNQQRNTQALCAYRHDLQNRVQSGNDFLKTHPHGIPGIPVGTIRVSIINSRRTLQALRPLVC